MVVPIIQMIGMTMGLTVWGVTNMLGGWVAGRYAAGLMPCLMTSYLHVL